MIRRLIRLYNGENVRIPIRKWASTATGWLSTTYNDLHRQVCSSNTIKQTFKGHKTVECTLRV